MKKESKRTEGTLLKPCGLRGMGALLPAHALGEKELPKELRTELIRMSKTATELLFEYIDYDEARELMRHGWPSRYFRHLQQIARKAKL